MWPLVKKKGEFSSYITMVVLVMMMVVAGADHIDSNDAFNTFYSLGFLPPPPPPPPPHTHTLDCSFSASHLHLRLPPSSQDSPGCGKMASCGRGGDTHSNMRTCQT